MRLMLDKGKPKELANFLVIMGTDLQLGKSVTEAGQQLNSRLNERLKFF